MPFTRTDDGPLAILTLAHGDLNLFDDAVFASLREEVGRLAAQPPRGLLVEARGRVVSAGVDVHVFEGLSPDAAGTLWRELLETIHALETLPCPTVFAAHALCLTAAFEIALACDLLVASSEATFGLVETVVGLTPSMGGPQRLARRAGPARAKRLVYSGELFDASTLHGWGVVTDLDVDARALALRLAAGPTRAHAATKRLVDAPTVAAADALVPEVSGALFATADLQGAVGSFLRDGPGRATFEGR
ncbi:enoyl-CoA hydratase/carnithine racemase [Solirubrobacter pauli]|uniref:Enoyl-CoA hydratase/carnithine racemase n=1 Tax=Solirubrobacter pauli TaxID=166793 RepID=A0A660KYB5_9ACTN|nr:enoyl-CoA hydratase/isomerase family protein [Solirubrobacter pauli]RKQ86158.1 enoyl-CoA hydratase/carnithine racemase [Solirubrobacter pauli]